jgi:hypothetical protein
MVKWLDDMFNKSIDKTAEQTDAANEFKKKAERSPWLGECMELDEVILRQEADNKIEAELKVRAFSGSSFSGVVTPEGYQILKDGEVVYMAGNHPGDSQVYLSSNDPAALPVEKLMEFAIQTGQEMAEDEGGQWVGLEKSASLVKSAAYEPFQTTEETLKHDYKRDVEILSDFTLASMIAEVRGHAKQDFMENATEYFEKAKKDVKADRKACEKELLEATGMSAQLDWRKSFEQYKKDEKPAEPTEKELYKPQLKDVNDDLSKGGKVDSYAETDEQHAKTMLGVGREADERTDVTEQPGEIHKDAALVRDPDVELKVGSIIRLARSIMSHEGIILQEGTTWEIGGIDGFHYTLNANGETHVISSHDTPKFNKIASQSKLAKSQAFDVFLNGKNIDTVFYSEGAKVDADEVKRSLINHDGYDSAIVVKKASQEIENHATKEQIIQKLAEIKSPWAVVEKDGQEVIARISDEQVVKESEEEKANLNK